MRFKLKQLISFSLTAIISLIISVFCFGFFNQNNLLDSVVIVWVVFTAINLLATLLVQFSIKLQSQARGALILSTIVGKVLLYLVFIVIWLVVAQSFNHLLLWAALFFYVIYTVLFISFALKQLS